MRTIRIINDIVIYFCFCFLAGTGLMMEFSFVKGAGPQYVLSMGKKAWETGHFWVGVVAILAFILHFCLNSRFFKNVLKTRIVYILFVIIGFGGAIFLAVWPTEKGEATAPAAQTSAQTAGQGYGKGMGKGALAWAKAPEFAKGRASRAIWLSNNIIPHPPDYYRGRKIGEN